MKKKSPLARAEGFFVFFFFFCCKAGFVCTLICLSLLCLSPDMDSLARPWLARLHSVILIRCRRRSSKHKQPTLGSLLPLSVFFFFFLRTLIVSPSSNYYAELLSWLSLVARYYFDVHSGCSMDSCISYVEGPISGDSGADSIPFSCLFGPRIPFRHSLTGVKKCIVTHPKVK